MTASVRSSSRPNAGDLGGTRRRALLLAAGAILLSPPLGLAQQPSKIRRIGFLGSVPPTSAESLLGAFRANLRQLGYLEGQNLSIEYRWPKGSFDKDPDLVSSLVRERVDVIVAWATPAALAARDATSTIPIVVLSVADPVRTGLVRSLAHPGGNITGVSNFSIDLGTKHVQLLMELFPGVQRIGVIRNAQNPGVTPGYEKTQRAIRDRGLQSRTFDARLPDEFQKAFERMNAQAIKAVVLQPDPSLIEHRTKIAEAALATRLATVFQRVENVEAGGLISYGPDLSDQFREAAGYVDKILKGAKPGDMPVALPTKFSLVINLKTAKALGMTMPPSVLLRADQVIE